MMVDNQPQTVHFLVSHIGEDDFILRYPWLAANNPNIDWKNSNIHFNQQQVSLTLQKSRFGPSYENQTRIQSPESPPISSPLYSCHYPIQGRVLPHHASPYP